MEQQYRRGVRAYGAARSARGLAAAWLLALGLLAAGPGHAAKGIPLPECAEKLLQCGGDAAKAVGQSVLTVGNLLGHVVANAECVAAMASGNPGALGVTGLVVGLGAAGVINPSACEANIYGVALDPLSSGIDAVLPGVNMGSKMKGASFAVAQEAFGKLPVPGAVPPMAGQLIGCGCGALEAGAQALEDVRKVAKFAAATYESCGAAVNACPGLKQALFVLKGVYQVVTDPSSIVQSCDSMSRHQYIDARLRDLIKPTADQFRDNIPWAGSNMEKNHWIPRKKACYSYYDSHCYKESEAENFCNAAVWDENFDPEVWAAITAEFNGPQFDLYFKNNLAKVAPKVACPADPGVSISLDPNTVGALEQKKAAQSANAKACNATMQTLLTGEKDSLRSFAHELLPTTREGWSNDVRLKQTEKPLDNAKKVFLRAMTAAAVVTRVKMEQAGAKFAAEDSAIASSGDNAAVPYVVLNQKYGEWAAIIAGGIKDGCPKDPNGYEKTWDLQCVKDVAAAVGMSAQDAAIIKLDGTIVAKVQASISNGSFAGSTYYNMASERMLKVPGIRIPGESVAQKTAFYVTRWQTVEPVISNQFLQDLPALLGRAFTRVEAEKALRKQQNEVFAALAANNKIEADHALSVCDKANGEGGVATPKSTDCRNQVSGVIKAETGKFNASQYKVFPNGFNPAKPAAEAVMAGAAADIKREHDAVLKQYGTVYRLLGIDPQRILLRDVGQAAKAGLAGVVSQAASAEDTTRQQQATTLAALAGAFADDGKRAKQACAKAPPARMQACLNDVDRIADAEQASVKGKIAAAFGSPPKSLAPTALGNTTRELNLAHGKTLTDYQAQLANYKVVADWKAPVAPGPATASGLVGGVADLGAPLTGAAPPAVALLPRPGQLPAGVGNTPPGNLNPAGVPGLNPGVAAAAPPAAGLPRAGQATLPAAMPPLANQPPGNTPAGLPGPNAGLQGLPPPPAPPGRVGMPSLPTMGMLPPPKAGPPAMVPGIVPPPAPAPTPAPAPAPAPVAIVMPPVAGNLGNQPVSTPNKPPAMVPGVAAAPPFDVREFRRERDRALDTEWLPQCKGNAGCTSSMEQLIARRIDVEVQAIGAGRPDHNNKAAVAAYLGQLDNQYDPQFKALIPKPAAIVAPPPPPTSAMPKTNQIKGIPGLPK